MGNIDCCASTTDRKDGLAQLREAQSEAILYNSESFTPRHTTKSQIFALFENENLNIQSGERTSPNQQRLSEQQQYGSENAKLFNFDTKFDHDTRKKQQAHTPIATKRRNIFAPRPEKAPRPARATTLKEEGIDTQVLKTVDEQTSVNQPEQYLQLKEKEAEIVQWQAQTHEEQNNQDTSATTDHQPEEQKILSDSQPHQPDNNGSPSNLDDGAADVPIIVSPITRSPQKQNRSEQSIKIEQNNDDEPNDGLQDENRDPQDNVKEHLAEEASFSKKKRNRKRGGKKQL